MVEDIALLLLLLLHVTDRRRRARSELLAGQLLFWEGGAARQDLWTLQQKVQVVKYCTWLFTLVTEICLQCSSCMCLWSLREGTSCTVEQRLRVKNWAEFLFFFFSIRCKKHRHAIPAFLKGLVRTKTLF